jgi:hypothetical protein
MTIQELKNLKVGDVVKRSKGVFWKITKATDWGIELIDLHGIVGRTIYFDFPDINQLASEYEIAQLPTTPDTDRQLRLVEAKIKDAEFDIAQFNGLNHKEEKAIDLKDYEERWHEIAQLRLEFFDPRIKRNKLIEQI